jgi:hypothetical protein
MRDTAHPADPHRTARLVVFGVTALVLGFFALFLLGETFTDPGGSEAWLLSAAWVLPAAALSVVAVLRPHVGGQVLAALTVTFAALSILEAIIDVIPEDDVGPVGLVVALALVIPLAFLGLKQARLAGWLLVGVGLSLGVGVLLETLGGRGPRPTAVVIAIPFALFGVLFLLTETGSRGSHRKPAPPRALTSH